MRRKKMVGGLFLLLGIWHAQAQQDTLRLSVDQIDSMFVKNSLVLLAEQYAVDARQFLIQQEKLWDNPSITAEVSAYNWDTQKAFDAGKNGQKIFTVQQLIVLAGKRDKRIDIARYDAQISEQEFYTLSRALKFQLRSSFYSLYFSLRTAALLQEQFEALAETIDAMEVQYNKGNIAYKDLMRLGALQFELSSVLLENKNKVQDELKTLRILLNSDQVVLPVLQEALLTKYNMDSLNVEDLVETGLANRSDLKMQQLLVERSKAYYKLQKAMSVPDLRIGGVYDQSGSYIQNYVGVNIGIDLPVFNRNQGNIKAAKAMAERSQLIYDSKQLEVRNEILTSLQKIRESENLYRSVDKKFAKGLAGVNESFLENFKKKNISLIEFIDFFETYNTVINQLNQLNARRVESYEELNYNTGKELF